MAKTNIEIKEEHLNRLYVKRAITKSKDFDAEIERIKEYLNRYYYGSK